jgi:hypothetical protein
VVGQGGTGFEARLADDPPTVLYAELLRDGRVAVGTRRQERDGSWTPGELHLLEPSAALDLAAWLSPLVEQSWAEAIRDRRAEPLRTARELYGEGPGGAERLGREMLREIPPELLARALILLANSIGPEARVRLVSQLNHTTSASEDSALRRRLADENEAFAYAVAAAALFDALARGATEEPDADLAG